MHKFELKINPFVAAVLLAATCVGSAQAQSNVVVYGRVDAGIDIQTNQVKTNADGSKGSGTVVGLGGNNWGTSMFGFKGTEDLGGGLKALFVLENGFSADTGQTNGDPSRIWSRRSLVGLSGNFGTVKLGRDLTLPSDIAWGLDPTGQQNLGSATLVKGRNWPQTSNSIQYISPRVNGFAIQGVYGFGEVAGATKPKSTGGAALTYEQGNYTAAIMYDFINDDNGRYTNVYESSKEITVGGTATFDKLKLFAAYQKLSAPQAVATTYNKADHYWLGARYMLTPALTLIGAAYHTKLNHDSGSANLFMIGTDYSLSKRTLLYTAVGTVRNKGQADFAVEVYPAGDSGSLQATNQNAFYAGIAHSF